MKRPTELTLGEEKRDEALRRMAEQKNKNIIILQQNRVFPNKKEWMVGKMGAILNDLIK